MAETQGVSKQEKTMRKFLNFMLKDRHSMAEVIILCVAIQMPLFWGLGFLTAGISLLAYLEYKGF